MPAPQGYATSVVYTRVVSRALEAAHAAHTYRQRTAESKHRGNSCIMIV
jgi:hypothetical protein